MADIGEELRLDAVGVLRLVLLHRVFLGELDELLRLLLKLLARAAEIGDGLAQRALVLEERRFLLLQRGDVGADGDEAAVVGAPLVDLQPAPVLDPRLDRARAGAFAAGRSSAMIGAAAVRA